MKYPRRIESTRRAADKGKNIVKQGNRVSL